MPRAINSPLAVSFYGDRAKAVNIITKYYLALPAIWWKIPYLNYLNEVEPLLTHSLKKTKK
jgi:hypothetical protein